MNFVLRKISRFIRPIANLIGLFFPIESKKIVVSHFSGKGYGDNPKYIINEILKRDADFRIIWILRNEEDKNSLPQGVEYCLEKTFMSTFHLRTAKVWIADYRMAFRFKRRNQFYLQTWHGFALKRIEKDAENNLSEGYVKSAIRDSKHIDLIVSCSRFMSEIYKKSFWYTGKVLEIGAPRNDIILQNDAEVKGCVFNHFGIDCDKGVVMYAPTFRANRSLEPYSLDFENLKNVCQQRFGKEFVVLVRLHPNIDDLKLNINFDNKNIFNATSYSDMQELLCAADIVISDYSSLMFDFALSKKPCFMFATDIAEYKADRNFYFELSSLPFAVAETNESLQENILNFDYKIYNKYLDNFFKTVGMNLDGNANKKCADKIFEVIGDNK